MAGVGFVVTRPRVRMSEHVIRQGDNRLSGGTSERIELLRPGLASLSRHRSFH